VTAFGFAAGLHEIVDASRQSVHGTVCDSCAHPNDKPSKRLRIDPIQRKSAPNAGVTT